MHAPYSRTTFGWRTRASARTSRRTAWVMARSAASLVLRWSPLRCFLIATGSPWDGRWGKGDGSHLEYLSTGIDGKESRLRTEGAASREMG